MKPWAEKFYHSSAWKKCQHAYFIKQHGICERCGEAGKIVHHQIYLTPENINNPIITLNEEHLELLCQDCHNKEHHGNKRNEPMFDEDGNFISTSQIKHPVQVFIVWGSPASGKTTYVRQHRHKGDLIIDLDLIMQSISMNSKSEPNDKLLPVALSIREHLYAMIERRKINCDNAWIVATLPRRYERMRLRERLKAKLIHIKATRDECIGRAHHDNERENKALQIRIIDKWFNEYDGE